MYDQKAFECDGWIAGTVESVHDYDDKWRSGGAWAVTEGEKGGDVVVVGWWWRRVSGGAEDGEVEGETAWFRDESCFGLWSFVFNGADEISESCYFFSHLMEKEKEVEWRQMRKNDGENK